MKKNQSQTIMEIVNQMDGVKLCEKKGGRFKFRMHMTREMSEAAIEALDLSVRSFNSLKRAGYNTVGEVAGAISSGKELQQIRNCGAKSVREIMEHLFLFQYNSLSADKRNEYLIEVVQLNKKGNCSVR